MSNFSSRGEQSTSDQITALTNLAALSTSPAGQFVRKTSATEFENASPSLSEQITIDSLSDVALVGTATLGEVLRYNGSTWENSPDLKIDNDGDVTIGRNLYLSGTRVISFRDDDVTITHGDGALIFAGASVSGYSFDAIIGANGSGGITTSQTTFPLVNDTATTVNFAGAATTLAIGAAASATTLTGQTLTFTGANGTNNSTLLVRNTSNAAAASHSIIDIAVGGTTSTGDAQLRLTIPSGTSYYIGSDNSDSDILKIGTGTAVGTNTLITVSSTGTFGLTDKIGTYSAVATAGWGVPAVYGTGRIVGTIDTRAAAAATYTVGAADGTFEVSGNVLVTTSTTHSFSLDVSYTDESNVARVLILPMTQLAGAFITGGLITNVTGAGPYEAPVITIRCKTATAITIRVSAGTFTTVVYNSEGVIKQIA